MGGIFDLLVNIGAFFFYFFVDYSMYLSIVTRLFTIDPSRGKQRVDFGYEDDKRSNKQLLQTAKDRLKERASITKKPWDLFVLNLEHFVSRLCTCRDSKFGRIIGQGTRSIRRELDIFRWLKTQREVQATIDTLTTFEQRRLIKHQVKAGLFVSNQDKNDKGGKRGKGGKGGKGGSDDGEYTEDNGSSSDEDFHFIEQQLKDGKELGDMDRKLLQGIIMPPHNDRKRHDKETEKERNARRARE